MKQARVGKGLTMSEMADIMGIHVQTYAKLEKHPEKISIEQANTFVKAVGLSFDEIFFGIKY